MSEPNYPSPEQEFSPAGEQVQKITLSELMQGIGSEKNKPCVYNEVLRLQQLTSPRGENFTQVDPEAYKEVFEIAVGVIAKYNDLERQYDSLQANLEDASHGFAHLQDNVLRFQTDLLRALNLNNGTAFNKRTAIFNKIKEMTDNERTSSGGVVETNDSGIEDLPDATATSGQTAYNDFTGDQEADSSES